MNGLIVMPEFYRERPTDDYKYILSGVGNHYGWPVQFTDRIPFTPDVLVVFAVPQHNRPGLMVDEILALPKSTKIIGWVQDIQTYGSRVVRQEQEALLDRFDLILCPRHEYFDKTLGQFSHKMKTLFQAFSTTERYMSLPWKNQPIMKCLVSGSKFKEVYPFRHMVATEGSPADFDVTPPWFKLYDEYAMLLNAYMCCFSDASIFKYCLRKYFEICAAGSLLIAEKCADSDEAGLLPWKHYVPVTPDSVFDVVDDVLTHPEKYLEIREQGRIFVIENHSVERRVQQMKEMIDESIR